MSSIKNKPFKFNKTLVVKGSKRLSTDPNKKMTEEEANEEVVQEFVAGTVVDAMYMGGRGGNAIQFEAVGGVLPNGEEYTDAVYYNIPSDAQYNPIDQNIPMPKLAEVIENVAKEDGVVVEDSKLSPLVMTAIVGGVLILGYLGYKHFNKAKVK